MDPRGKTACEAARAPGWAEGLALAEIRDTRWLAITQARVSTRLD